MELIFNSRVIRDWNYRFAFKCYHLPYWQHKGLSLLLKPPKILLENTWNCLLTNWIHHVADMLIAFPWENIILLNTLHWYISHITQSPKRNSLSCEHVFHWFHVHQYTYYVICAFIYSRAKRGFSCKIDGCHIDQKRTTAGIWRAVHFLLFYYPNFSLSTIHGWSCFGFWRQICPS